MGIFFIGMTMLTGCTKEVVGPKGEQGVQGEQGPKGDKGNANVIGTNTITINSNDWTYNSSNREYTVGLNTPGITQDIVNNGLVQVFRVYSDVNVSLPEIIIGHVTEFGFSNGLVKLYRKKVDGSTPTEPSSGKYRVVIISASGLAAHPDLDYTNYKEVKEAFNL